MNDPKQFEYEEKFIVINKKRFDELINKAKDKGMAAALGQALINQLNTFSTVYQATTGKPMDQKYFVVNQDEPYAEKVLDLIEQEENKKVRGINNEEEG